MERAAARDSLIQMHVAEIPRSWPTLGHPGRHDDPPLGAPRRAGPALAVHATWADDEEIEPAAATATSVSHNAASNLKILGVPRVAEWLEAGINVALGTDGAPPTTE